MPTSTSAENFSAEVENQMELTGMQNDHNDISSGKPMPTSTSAEKFSAEVENQIKLTSMHT